MAWMIIKSAGDEYSFVATKVEGEIGHPYDYACKQARKVTEAMRHASAPILPIGGTAAWARTIERQPKQAGWYLAVVPTRWGDNMVTMGYYDLAADFWTLESDAQVEAADNPTHWQPLPALPEGL